MKKNRPAVTLSALAPPDSKEDVARAILHHTTTFGVRMNRAERLCLQRTTETVDTEYGGVTVKIGRLDDSVQTVAPEFDECVQRAHKAGVAARDVYAAAAAEAHRLAQSLREDH
jgi:hypothetical protein